MPLSILLLMVLSFAWLGTVLPPRPPLLRFAPAPPRPRYVVRVEVRWVRV